MSEKTMATGPATTDRRSFLKTGALAAAPLAAAAPAAALADDGSGARLARLEDERAIEGLHRAFLRRFNGKGGDACGEFFACGRGPALGEELVALADAGAEEPQVEFARDGARATVRRAARAEFDTAIAGDTTVERMTRLQGHGNHRHGEDRTFVAEYVKGKAGWRIERVTLG